MVPILKNRLAEEINQGLAAGCEDLGGERVK